MSKVLVNSSNKAYISSTGKALKAPVDKDMKIGMKSGGITRIAIINGGTFSLVPPTIEMKSGGIE